MAVRCDGLDAVSSLGIPSALGCWRWKESLAWRGWFSPPLSAETPRRRVTEQVALMAWYGMIEGVGGFVFRSGVFLI